MHSSITNPSNTILYACNKSSNDSLGNQLHTDLQRVRDSQVISAHTSTETLMVGLETPPPPIHKVCLQEFVREEGEIPAKKLQFGYGKKQTYLDLCNVYACIRWTRLVWGSGRVFDLGSDSNKHSDESLFSGPSSSQGNITCINLSTGCVREARVA